MLSGQRRELIAREVRDNGFVNASELAERLDVSRVTVWRDIDQLARVGVVAKVHGGAAPPVEHPAGGLAGHGVPSGLTIGMQIPTKDYYYRAVVDGARAMCESFGARLVVSVSGYSDGDADRVAIDSLIGIGVDGLLLTPSVGSPWTGISPDFLRRFQIPYVLVERDLAGLGGHHAASVTTAHRSGVHAAVEHLVELGHQRIGLVTNAARSSTRERIQAGFHGAIIDFGLASETDPPWVRDGRDNVAELHAEVRSAGITAVIAFGDTLALALSHQVRLDAGRVPRDLSIVAYDDEIAADALPPLTAISPRRTDLGRTAASQLLTHLAGGEPLSGRRTELEPLLVLRESTAPAG